MKWADFLYADTNLGKPRVIWIIIGWILSQNGQDLVYHGTLKSGVSYK